MKKSYLLYGLMFILIATLATGCSSPAPTVPTPEATIEAPVTTLAETVETPTGVYADGTYFAAQDDFDPNSGWKTYVFIEVKDGKIISADWNGVSVNGGLVKKEASKAGKYPMVEAGGAKAPWHEQALLAESYLIEKQDPKLIEYSNPEGNTDAISGVSIHVSDFFSMTEKALAAGPTVPGRLKDGAYHAEQMEFASSGWKETIDLTVVNGNIMAVNWNGIHKDGGDDKKTASKNGTYGMVANGGAKAEWHEQAMSAERYLLEKQDPSMITYSDDEGHTDAIAGVSVHVSSMFELAQEALK